jgi:predicted ATPase
MLDTGFVDREEELERLSELLSEAESGNPKLAFICGESGIGKRSLIEEFLKEKRGMLVLRHDCTPTKRNIPYGILSGLLDDTRIIELPDPAFQESLTSRRERATSGRWRRRGRPSTRTSSHCSGTSRGRIRA